MPIIKKTQRFFLADLCVTKDLIRDFIKTHINICISKSLNYFLNNICIPVHGAAHLNYKSLHLRYQCSPVSVCLPNFHLSQAWQRRFLTSPCLPYQDWCSELWRLHSIFSSILFYYYYFKSNCPITLRKKASLSTNVID